MSGSEAEDRDFSDDETEECQKRKLTARERATKYLAAKATGSKAGRALIQKATGDDGMALLEIFTEVMKKFSEKHPQHRMDADKVRKNLFKVMVKCAVFLDNGLLVENQFNDVSIAAAKFAWMFLDMCELSMVFYEGGKLQELLTEIQDGIATLLDPLVTGKSIERLTELRKSLSPEFFEYLLKDADVNDQRSSAGGRVLKILEDRKIPRPAQDKLETSS